jgi:hypothetical protein
MAGGRIPLPVSHLFEQMGHTVVFELPLNTLFETQRRRFLPDNRQDLCADLLPEAVSGLGCIV